MIGDLAKEINIESGVNRRANPYVVFSYRKKYPGQVESVFEDASFFYCTGYGFVEYRKATVANKYTKEKGEFLFNSDTIPKGVMRVKGITDLREKSKANPRLEWFVNHSNVSAKIFKIARDNPYTKIPVCVKIEEIYDELKKIHGTGVCVFCEGERINSEVTRKKLQRKIRKEKGSIIGGWL